MPQLSTQFHAIIFDFGGVLIDWNPHYLYRKLFNGGPEAIERFLTDIHFRQWNLQQDQGRPFALAVALLSEQFPHYADLIKAYDERWEESVAGPIQSTVNILYMLKQVGYPLYGLSNWSAEKFRLARAKYAFFDWFESIMISGEVRLVKPDPRIYTLLLEQIGRRAEECVFIDDSAVNIVAAERLGFNVVRYESSKQLQQALHRLGLLPRLTSRRQK